MAYHIHQCKVHNECTVLVNLNHNFRTHLNVTNAIKVPPYHGEKSYSFNDDDDCLTEKVD